MKNKLAKIFLLLFVFPIFAVQTFAQQELKKFAGKYVTGHDFGAGSIKLNSDGTFSEGGGSDDGSAVSSSGSYSFSDGFLHFKVENSKFRRAGEESETADSEDKTEGKREFKILPVEWSGRIYLIYEKELKNFVNAINLTIEPRPALYSSDDSSPWFGSFYLREGDEKKKVTGNPELPKEWLSFLLTKPVSAKITNIREIEKLEFSTIKEVTINKGSKDGLKVGMQLVAKDEVPSQWSGMNIISVEKNSAKIQVRLSANETLKIGDKLSTKYMPKRLY